MKRLIAIVISIVLIASILPITASAASGSLTGPGSARPGQTITLTFRISGGQFYGYSGSLSYDSSVVTLQSVSNSAGGNWAFTSSGGKIVAYDNTGNNHPVSSAFVAKFKVNNGVSAGTAIKVSFSGTASGGGSESGVSGSYSGTVSAPLSGDATLSSLKVSNATLSPAFNANTTSYSCGKVGFDVSRLSVNATANDSGAKVSVSGSSLSVGKNTVRITVTAPNGAKKTYSISVTREQDPNYVPSNNTKLSGITLSEGKLSPAYSVDVKEYVVYLPYETAMITISGAAADPLAKGVEGVTEAALEVGLNDFEIKCTAEDGTVGVYKIHVVRMSEFSGIKSLVLPDSSKNIVDESTTVPTTAKSEPEAKAAGGVSPILMGILAVVCFILGIAIGVVISRRKKGGPSDDDGFDDTMNSGSGDDGSSYEEGKVGYIDYDTYMEGQ